MYKAFQRSLNRPVALKMILRGELASTADLARFRAEAESAARLEHPNIVSVYEVGEQGGQAYFSMQYISGRTLADLVAEGPLHAPGSGLAPASHLPGRSPRPPAWHFAPRPQTFQCPYR